jgi:hypothetical protein
MSMSTEIDEQKTSTAANPTPSPAPPPRGSWATRLRSDLGQLDWRTTALVAAAMALVWVLMMFTTSMLQLLAGIVPLLAGLYLGRAVKERLLLHGLVLGLLGFVFGLGFAAIYAVLADAGLVPTPEGIAGGAGIMLFYIGFSPFALIPFPAFGTITAGRNEARARAMRKEFEQRGGKLEGYSRVADLSDLQGLSLPQFGKYVADLFKKRGFGFKDYRFIDKDKHLDLYLEYKGEPWLLRLSVSDKVRTGTVETLAQEMRQREVAKGLAITSTEFTPDALKSAKGKRQILLIDGATLLAMAEG